MVLGTRKMPLPMMVPTTTAVAAAAPNSRNSPEELRTAGFLSASLIKDQLSLCCLLLMALSRYPTTNVTVEPKTTYQVKATLVCIHPTCGIGAIHNHRLRATPHAIPIRAPVSVARLVNTPSKNTPNNPP